MTQTIPAAEKDLPLPLARLTDDEDVGRLVGVAFDFLMHQPVSRFVTAAQVLNHLELALRPAHVRRVMKEHLRQGLEREQERARAHQDRLGSYLTGEAREILLHLAARPVRLNPQLLEGIIGHDAVRHLVRVVVVETLGRFIQLLRPAAGTGPLGKGLFARLGAQMEVQLSKVAGGFVASSLDFLLGRLANVLATVETEEQLGRLRAEGIEAALQLRTSTLWDLSEDLDLEEILEVVPGLVEHNLGRPEVREAILAEAAAALEVEGERTLAELLEPEAVATWRADFVELAGPLLSELVGTGPFEQWLIRR
jgi:hypothetical protein